MDEATAGRGSKAGASFIGSFFGSRRSSDSSRRSSFISPPLINLPPKPEVQQAQPKIKATPKAPLGPVSPQQSSPSSKPSSEFSNILVGEDA